MTFGINASGDADWRAVMATVPAWYKKVHSLRVRMHKLIRAKKGWGHSDYEEVFGQYNELLQASAPNLPLGELTAFEKWSNEKMGDLAVC